MGRQKEAINNLEYAYQLRLAKVTKDKEDCVVDNRRLIIANQELERTLADARARLKTVVEERERKLEKQLREEQIRQWNTEAKLERKIEKLEEEKSHELMAKMAKMMNRKVVDLVIVEKTSLESQLHAATTENGSLKSSNQGPYSIETFLD